MEYGSDLGLSGHPLGFDRRPTLIRMFTPPEYGRSPASTDLPELDCMTAGCHTWEGKRVTYKITLTHQDQPYIYDVGFLYRVAVGTA